MLHAMIPYRPDANLGAGYNAEMERLPEGDWAVFLDHDAMPTTGKWHAQFSEAAAFLPDAGAIVGMANRIAAVWQRCGDRESNDIAWHRRFGAERAKVRTLVDVSMTRGWGGVFFAISKDAWRAAGGFADGLGCVDHSIHYRLRAIGRKVWMHEGIYAFHWRHWGEPDPTSAHPKAANCPCRGVEIPPGERIALP